MGDAVVIERVRVRRRLMMRNMVDYGVGRRRYHDGIVILTTTWCFLYYNYKLLHMPTIK